MLGILIKFSFFIGIGVAWRLAKPMGISAEELRNSLLTALYFIFIPALIISIMWQAKLSANTTKVLLVMLLATAASLAAAWFAYQKVSTSSNTKGALIIAAAFSSIIIVGAPVSQAWIARWTLRMAVYYEAIVMLPILFIAGGILANKLSGSNRNVALDLVKEPVILALALGLILSLTQTKMPIYVANWLNITKLGVLPIGLIVVGLSLNWNQQSSNLIPILLPAAAIQLIVMPLAIWAAFYIVGINGQTQTFRSMFIHAAMPSMIYGLLVCDRYNFDTEAYAAAFSLTTILSVITVPIWWTLIKNGTIG